MMSHIDPVPLEDRTIPGSRQRDALEVALVLAIAAGGQVVSHSADANSVAGNNVAVATILVELALILTLLRRRGEPWASLGLARPRSGWKTLGLALLLSPVVMALAGMVQQGLFAVLPTESPDLSRFDSLRGNLPRLLAAIPTVWVTAAIAEEVIYRGFLMGRLSRLLGGGRAAWWSSLVVSSVLFGLAHLYQGALGVALTGFIGLAVGALYILTRNLWLCILIHGFFDTTSLTMVYVGATP